MAPPLQQVIDGWEATYPGQIAGGGFDVSTTEGVQQLVDLAVNKFGGVDVLVNNAATTAAGTVTTLTDEQWQAEFDIKLMSMVRTARTVAPIMKERGGGSIVNINAIFASQPDLAFYASSVIRAGSLNLTNLLAKEFAHRRHPCQRGGAGFMFYRSVAELPRSGHRQL